MSPIFQHFLGSTPCTLYQPDVIIPYIHQVVFVSVCLISVTSGQKFWKLLDRMSRKLVVVFWVWIARVGTGPQFYLCRCYWIAPLLVGRGITHLTTIHQFCGKERRRRLGPYSLQSVGAVLAVSLAIEHNPGRVATPTQYSILLTQDG